MNGIDLVFLENPFFDAENVTPFPKLEVQVSKECYEAWANSNMKQGHLDLPPPPSNSDIFEVY